MNLRVWDLGQRHKGEIVEVTLKGTAANVLLMDSTNLNSYKRGRKARYYGGNATRSPVRLPVPRNGRWHIVIDHGGYSGKTRASVRVLPGALPTIRQPQSPIAQVAENAAELISHDDSTDVVDVFVSHASEDKETVARPLAEALRARGLSVWFDEYELRVGDSLRRKIDSGLRRSRFGIVVLSPTFFTKGWAQYELDGLVTLSVTGKQVLLPIWHNLTRNDLIQHSPTLADKVALLTNATTIDEIADEIADVVGTSSAAA